jgi:hypothetical protein
MASDRNVTNLTLLTPATPRNSDDGGLRSLKLRFEGDAISSCIGLGPAVRYILTRELLTIAGQWALASRSMTLALAFWHLSPALKHLCTRLGRLITNPLRPFYFIQSGIFRHSFIFRHSCI